MGFNRHDARRRVQAALDKVGLPNREKSMPVTLSGGEQQRLCIARAVVSRPNILIADEPSANLDRSYALDIMELFKSFHQVGTTVLISAHDETLMENYGRRIIRLKEGQFAS
jgi:cell division transport system ATP-binding protein